MWKYQTSNSSSAEPDAKHLNVVDKSASSFTPETVKPQLWQWLRRRWRSHHSSECWCVCFNI